MPISTVGRLLSPVGPHATRCSTNAATTPTAAIAVSRRPSVIATVYSATSAGPSRSRTAGAATTAATTDEQSHQGLPVAQRQRRHGDHDRARDHQPAAVVLWSAAGITATCGVRRVVHHEHGDDPEQAERETRIDLHRPLMSKASRQASGADLLHAPTIRADLAGLPHPTGANRRVERMRSRAGTPLESRPASPAGPMCVNDGAHTFESDNVGDLEEGATHAGTKRRNRSCRNHAARRRLRRRIGRARHHHA